jgi:hypothetical protein
MDCSEFKLNIFKMATLPEIPEIDSINVAFPLKYFFVNLLIFYYFVITYLPFIAIRYLNKNSNKTIA